MAPKRKELISSPQRQAKSPVRQAKKAKKDPAADKLNEQLAEVVATLKQAELSGQVGKMLSAVVPLSLGEFSEQRHPFQKRVVDGIASVLGEIEAALKSDVAEKKSTRDQATAGKPEREKEAADGEVKLNSKIAEVQSAKVALAGKAMAFRAARTALAESDEAKVVDGRMSRDAETKKADFEAALENLTALKTAPPGDAEGRKKSNELMAQLKKHKFEESMMIALPAALAKAPEARGQFDAMVIGQLETEMAKNISEQSKILADAIPGQERCAAAIKAAQATLDTARGEQRVAAQFFDNLSKEQDSCTEASAAAQKAVRDIVASLKKLDKALHNAEVEVEIFEQGPLETFKELSERVAPPQAAEEEEAAVPMDESTAELEVPVAAC